MAKLFISNKDESVRMFKSNFLDFFTKVHFTVPLYIFVPVVLYFSYKAIFVFHLAIWLIVLLFAAGIFFWTFIEYCMHRFAFHYYPTTEWGKRLHFLFHGVHHDYPNDSRRLVMVPSVSVPLAFLLYFAIAFLMGTVYTSPFFAGLISGYLFYDISHYALHHFNFKSKFWLDLKNYHMIHHYKDGNNGFGVTSGFWDKVFQTKFK